MCRTLAVTEWRPTDSDERREAGQTGRGVTGAVPISFSPSRNVTEPAVSGATSAVKVVGCSWRAIGFEAVSFTGAGVGSAVLDDRG
jgi:hypothetical protein